MNKKFNLIIVFSKKRSARTIPHKSLLTLCLEHVKQKRCANILAIMDFMVPCQIQSDQ